uniref:Uncharacterized protein n=1 Tax=Mus musculus TaxID=10090 RepID=Q3TYN6_MOUSE|nr:unnamed protein product [Mus musculus]
MPGTWSCRWSRRLMVPGAGGSWPASRAHPEAPFLISWGLERTGGLEELWRLGARASVPWRLQALSSHYSRQSWVVALVGGWESAGPHVTRGGLGDSMGEVLLQPSGVRQPAVSQ